MTSQDEKPVEGFVAGLIGGFDSYGVTLEGTAEALDSFARALLDGRTGFRLSAEALGTSGAFPYKGFITEISVRVTEVGKLNVSRNGSNLILEGSRGAVDLVAETAITVAKATYSSADGRVLYHVHLDPTSNGYMSSSSCELIILLHPELPTDQTTGGA